MRKTKAIPLARRKFAKSTQSSGPENIGPERPIPRRPAPEASAQPRPHNPRKQRKNPAAAGSGERFREGKWRRERDSNPRDGSPPTHFPGVRHRPLGHLSGDATQSLRQGRRKRPAGQEPSSGANQSASRSRRTDRIDPKPHVCRSDRLDRSPSATDRLAPSTTSRSALPDKTRSPASPRKRPVAADARLHAAPLRIRAQRSRAAEVSPRARTSSRPPATVRSAALRIAAGFTRRPR